jgi:cell division protein FtsI (penicillin-binding protein 3)
MKVKEAEMPLLIGTGLRDALALCEEKGLAVRASGKGKVTAQSIAPGSPVQAGKIIQLQLN